MGTILRIHMDCRDLQGNDSILDTRCCRRALFSRCTADDDYRCRGVFYREIKYYACYREITQYQMFRGCRGAVYSSQHLPAIILHLGHWTQIQITACLYYYQLRILSWTRHGRDDKHTSSYRCIAHPHTQRQILCPITITVSLNYRFAFIWVNKTHN